MSRCYLEINDLLFILTCLRARTILMNEFRHLNKTISKLKLFRQLLRYKFIHFSTRERCSHSARLLLLISSSAFDVTLTSRFHIYLLFLNYVIEDSRIVLKKTKYNIFLFFNHFRFVSRKKILLICMFHNELYVTNKLNISIHMQQY